MRLALASWRMRLIAVAVGLVIGSLLGLCGGLMVISANALQDEFERAAAARLVYDATASLSLSVMDAEVAQRNFLVARRQIDLLRFQEAAGRARTALRRLAADATQNDWLSPRLSLVTLLAQTQLATLAVQAGRVSPEQRSGRLFSTEEIAAQQVNAAAFSAAVAEIQTQAEAERQRHLKLFRQNQRWVEVEILVAAAICAALLGATALGLLVSRGRLIAAQETLRREGERLAAMANHIRDGVAVFGSDDRLMLWNNAFFPASGLPPELGRVGTGFGRFAAAAADWFPPLLDEPRPHGEPIVAEMQRQGRVLEVWRSALPDGGQILAIADISKRVEAEQMARQAQKMDALGQLTGGIAHDMNNLLQVISANLEQLAQRLPADGGMRMRLDAAMAGVARGANLTRHLLAFARRQPLATEVIEPGELLRGTADLLRRTLGETYEVRLALDEEEERWAIRTDPQRLENAVLNLALNARDAMPTGGRLVIIVTNRVLDEEYATRHAEVTPGQYVMIAVADTGQEMTPEQIAHAVEPFYTTKGAGRGTGLGLSMVYGLVRQSGGHFHIDSVAGGGTTVRLYLPRTYAARTTEPRLAPPAAGRGELVLVVEDDLAVRTVAISSLQDLGYRTLAAENAEVALELLRAGARPNVLFTDVVMPGSVSATDLARAARGLLPSLAVLFTTGYTDNPALSSYMPDPSIRLLSKPWTRAALAESLSDALRTAAGGKTREAPAAEPLKILLVEDEPMVRETTAELLGAMGHSVRATSSAAEARQAAGDVELVIADAGLPDADGTHLAAEFRRQRPSLPMIIVSGREARASGDPAVVWLEKPFDEAKLRQAIARARAAAVARAA